MEIKKSEIEGNIIQKPYFDTKKILLLRDCNLQCIVINIEKNNSK